METLQPVLGRAIRKEHYNSYNGWESGEEIGIVYYFNNGYMLEYGKAYFRYLPPKQIIRWYKDGAGCECPDISEL